jgi:hypothetical protein
MVEAIEACGSLEGEDVGRRFNDAEKGGVASGVGTDFAEFFFGEKPALGARRDGVGGAVNGLGKGVGMRVFGLDHPEGDAFRAA